MAMSKHHSLVGKIMNSNNPYEILGVSQMGNKEDIDRCYKWTMSKVHPDKNNHPLATKAAQKVNVSRDILLKGGMNPDLKLDPDLGELYTNIREEIVKLLTALKFMVFFVLLFAVVWLIHLLNYVFANEWSVVKTPLHNVERRTTLYRIRYYTLSSSTTQPAETQIFREYVKSMFDSCKEHLERDPWYGIFLYYPQDDLCTEGKITLIYTLAIIIVVKIVCGYITRRRLKSRSENV